MHMVGIFIAFLVSFSVLRHLSPSGILFYQGLVLAATASIAQVLIASLWKRNSWITSVKDGLMTLIAIYAFLITVPTVAERSFTVVLLKQLARVPDGMSRDEVRQLYISEFLDGAIDKRLIEQRATGTVAELEGKYTLTAKGETVESMFRATCGIFVCQ